MPTCRVDALKAHPLNRKIYGDHADEGLVESIRQHGILTPLLITKSHVVISGHRRLDAARQLGLDEVPVTVAAFSDKLAAEEALIAANEQRQRTVEQRVREYVHLKAIEAERARQRAVRSPPNTSRSGEALLARASPGVQQPMVRSAG